MKIEDLKYRCIDCRYRNGNVCDICYEQIYEDFTTERMGNKNGETDKRDPEKNENNREAHYAWDNNRGPSKKT